MKYEQTKVKKTRLIWIFIRSQLNGIFSYPELPLLADDPNHSINADVMHRHWLESVRSRGFERSFL